MHRVYVGFDPREADAFAVARSSIMRHSPMLEVRGVVLARLRESGLYTRPMEMRRGVDRPIMWDTISGAAMATEHACARFLVPIIQRHGFALFMDGDVLVRASLEPLFDLAKADRSKAVWVVKHDYRPKNAAKMDGQVQTRYNRKLWSAVCLWNCDHPATRALTAEMVNTLPGRDLHAFAGLKDDEIGALGEEWHWVPGHSPETVEPRIVHFSEGTPAMPGYHGVAYADEWRAELYRWAY